MKRLDLVQLSLIITGICSAFFCIDQIPRFLVYMFAWFSSGLTGGYMMESFIETILLLTGYLLFSLFSIRSSKQLAEWISNKADLHGDINFSLSTRELLFALFIGLGVYGLIRDLPQLLADGYSYLKDHSHTIITDLDMIRPKKGTLFIQITKVALFFTLLVYANIFARFFADRINNTEPPDEIEHKLT
jgi:hypothetical protein